MSASIPRPYPTDTRSESAVSQPLPDHRFPQELPKFPESASREEHLPPTDSGNSSTTFAAASVGMPSKMSATSASGKFSRISAALPARKNFHQERLLLCRQVRHHKLLILQGKVSQSLRSTSCIRPLDAFLQISPGATGLGNSASVWHFQSGGQGFYPHTPSTMLRCNAISLHKPLDYSSNTHDRTHFSLGFSSCRA